ncbi:MAG TPA: TRAP transporter small permease subunit, partial [Rhodoferax sp.]|nr:TRAP transporter small permease subunit [Rhodoferax sp.]
MQEPIPGADPGAATLEFGPVGRLLFRASKVSAIMGGLMFVAIVVMSIISIVGRKLFAAPVPGDVEMLQMTAAFASASFFAYCHLNGGDVKVDFFTAKASPATVHRLDAFGSLLVGLF